MVFLGGSAPVIQKGSVTRIGAVHAAETILYDDLESSVLKWTKYDVTGVGTVARNTTTVFAGGASLSIASAGAANDSTSAARIFGLNRIGLSGIVRVSMAFYNGMTAANDSIIFLFYDPDGTNLTEFKLRLLMTAADTGKLQYQNAAGAYVDITAAINFADTFWYFIEFDCDTVNNKLLSVSIGGTNYPVNATMKATANTGLLHSLYLYTTTGEAAAKTNYFDEILVRNV